MAVWFFFVWIEMFFKNKFLKIFHFEKKYGDLIFSCELRCTSEFTYWSIWKITHSCSIGTARKRMLPVLFLGNSLRRVPLAASQSKTILTVVHWFHDPKTVCFWSLLDLPENLDPWGACIIFFEHGFVSSFIPCSIIFFEDQSSGRLAECCTHGQGREGASWSGLPPLPPWTSPEDYWSQILLMNYKNVNLTQHREIGVSPSRSTSNTNQVLPSWNETSSTWSTVRWLLNKTWNRIGGNNLSRSKHRGLTLEELISIPASMSFSGVHGSPWLRLFMMALKPFRASVETPVSSSPLLLWKQCGT